MTPTVEEAALPAAARTPSQHARRQRILASAQRLLQDREFEQIQIREVAEDADVALGTLYRYFPSKELLYAHALLAWSDAFGARVQAQSRGAESDADRLRAVLRAAVRAYERAPRFFRLLTLLEVTAEPPVRAVFAAFSDRFMTMVLDALPETDPRDKPAIALVAAAVLNTCLQGWSQGLTPIRTVYERLDETVTLIFSQPRRSS